MTANAQNLGQSVAKGQKTKLWQVIVIGSGFAGLGAAIKLREAGINDFIVLEKANELGGVWRENTYPGCACDVPSSLYSYSFAPNPHWSRVFAEQAEIKAYLQKVAQDYGVIPHIHMQQEMLDAAWDNQENFWRVKTQDQEYQARFVIMACGPMHEPVYPKIKGLADFKGTIFHSARWRHDYDLTGKRVAVIGTGASAIQFVPKIQPKVAELVLFQRTPQWILPKLDQALPPIAQKLFKHLPLTQLAMRGAIYTVFETLNGGMHHPNVMKQFQRLALFNLHKTVKDPYSAKRGFWFSHIGWMLRDYPSGQLDYSNSPDLLKNKIVMFQHKHYLPLVLLMNIAIPMLVGYAIGDFWGGVLLIGLLRLVLSHHFTFFINSLAHMWGTRPYTDENTARDNFWLALLTYGEGYHNFHHIFQYDYRNGVKWWQFDPTKWLIFALSCVGLTTNLKRIPDFTIRKAQLLMQFKRAQQELEQKQRLLPNVDIEALKKRIAQEYDAFVLTMNEWGKLKEEWYNEKKQAVLQKWEDAAFKTRFNEIEYRLKMQSKRMQLLMQQMVQPVTA